MHPTESHNCSSPRRFLMTLVLGIVAFSAGCAKPAAGDGGTSTTSPVSDPNYKFATGNWVFSATAPGGTFATLSGFVDEQGGDPGTNDFTTAAMQAQSSSCYSSSPILSFEGTVTNTTVSLTSFTEEGQVMTISATKNAAANAVTGTYSVSGGCANGASGAFSGVLYQPLNGTYSSAVSSASPTPSVQLTLAQATQGDGSGISFLSGSASFQNISCFTGGTVSSPGSYVLGNRVSLSVRANDSAGSQILAAGIFDAAGDTITFPSIAIVSGSCVGSFGPATLTLQ